MTALRLHELRALRQLVEAHTDGPDEWGPEHWSTAESAAVILREFLRREDRTPRRSAPQGNPTPASVREAVLRRSGGRCEAGTIWCLGKPTQIHHKDRNRKNNTMDNLLHVCGNGNATGCHGRIHQEVTEAFAEGWLTRRNR